MCLLAFSWQPESSFPLVLVGNRDEFHARPAAPLRFWDDAPDILAGRDGQEGGTWLGVTRSGRWATLTNYREPGAPAGTRSRGHLVADFLNGAASPLAYLEQVARQAGDYSGFNLLVGDRREAAVYGNRGDVPRRLAPGLYGLSNHLLDSPWPKLERLKAGLGATLAETDEPDLSALLALLEDTTQPADEDLPDTGVGLELERLLGRAFIRSPRYGTRASSVLMLAADRARLVEQTWDQGERGELADLGFLYDPDPAA